MLASTAELRPLDVAEPAPMAPVEARRRYDAGFLRRRRVNS